MSALADFAQDLEEHLARHSAVETQSVARLWGAGFDTWQMAQMLRLPEPHICNILARLQDERHAARQGAQP